MWETTREKRGVGWKVFFPYLHDDDSCFSQVLIEPEPPWNRESQASCHVSDGVGSWEANQFYVLYSII